MLYLLGYGGGVIAEGPMRGLAEQVAAISGLESCPRGRDAIILYYAIGEQVCRQVFFIPTGKTRNNGFAESLRQDFYDQAPVGSEYTFAIMGRSTFNAYRLARGIAQLEQSRIAANADGIPHEIGLHIERY